jgi:hypothetical protein
MARRLSVVVDMDSSKYVRGAGELAVSTKKARDEVDDLGRSADKAGGELDAMAVQAKLAEKELKNLDATVVRVPGHEDQLRIAAREAAQALEKDLAAKAKQAEADLKFLDKRIATVQRSIKNLGLEFSATGDLITGKRIGQQTSLLATLEKVRKELDRSKSKGGGLTLDSLVKLGGEASLMATIAGTQAGSNFAKAFGDSTDVAGPEVQGVLKGALVAGAAAAAPAIGAAVSGAVVGGVGTLGLAGGIFAASRDPLVQSAAQDFASSLAGTFFRAGKSFVDPIRESLGILKADVESLDLESLFAKAAPSLTIITSGIGDMVKNTMPGLNKAFDRMEPFARAAANGFAQIGTALSGFLDDVSRSHGAIIGLQMLFAAVSLTINALGKILLGLSNTLQFVSEAWEKVVNIAVGFAGALDLPTDKLKQYQSALHDFNTNSPLFIQDTGEMGGSIFDLGNETEIAKQKVQDFQQKMQDFMTAELGLADATTAVAQDFADLGKNLDEGKGKWDNNSQAGRNNQTVLRGVIGDLERQREQAIATSDGTQASVDAINRKYNEQINHLNSIAIQAGATKGQLDAMAANRRFTIVGDVILHNASVLGNKYDKNQTLRLGYASGGDPPPGWAWAGEHGPELIKFRGGEHVFNHEESMAMTKPYKGGSAAASVPSQITVVASLDPMMSAGNRDLGTAVLQMLRFKVQAGYSLTT